MPFNGHTYGVEIILDLVAIASYACVVVASVLLRQTQALAKLIDDCSERISPGRAQFRLWFWGLAIAITIPWLAIGLFRTKVLGIIGLALLPIAIALVGTAVAVTAAWIENSWQQAHEADVRKAPMSGVLVLAVASATPVLGWVVMATCILPSLGAIAEYIISGGRKTSPHQTLVEHNDRGAELIPTKTNEDAA
jgi:hypothetical protein